MRRLHMTNQPSDTDSKDETNAQLVQQSTFKDVPTIQNNDAAGEEDAPVDVASSTTTTPEMKLPPKWKILAAYFGFISFWPILAFVQVYLRAHEFDVDTFLTVKGLLDAAAPDDNGSWDRNDMILELPPLSPAERMVDALFGPNQVDRRGF